MKTGPIEQAQQEQLAKVLRRVETEKFTPQSTPFWDAVKKR